MCAMRKSGLRASEIGTVVPDRFLVPHKET